MNFYLRAGSMSDDVILVSDGDESSNYSLRFEELKGFKNSSNSSKGLVQKIDSDYYTEGVSQVFIYLCGSTISHQQNLYTSNVNMLMKAACDKVGVKSNDFYSTFCGKVLHPEQLLSYYHVKKDSTIRINSRLRGGCSSNWDAIISGLGLFRLHTVSIPQALFLPSLANQGSVVEVKYLGEVLQFCSRKVLIHLCRRHFSGVCFGGEFTSEQIVFDEDGNVKINAARKQYTKILAVLDYNRLYDIFDKAFKDEGNRQPIHTLNLLSFLHSPPPAIDPQSDSIIAYLTNHMALLSHTERIAISALLDLLFSRLDKEDKELFRTYLKFVKWTAKVQFIPAMNTIYNHFKHMNKKKKFVPYEDNRISLLRFSTNFFKHSPKFSPEELEAAFSFFTASESFIAQLVYDALVTFKDGQKPCTAKVHEFVDRVIAMLGKNTIGCTKG
uniref:Ubiquitin-like domain-containing protein n=5 Tax=Aegilops tauschii subsp. strangulata TaxID=200361 RepID=A0A453A8Z2_AEGTS|nr:uncharacterized protein LOC109748105 [Aegilops tauschii subsp. strangulata]